MKFNDNNDKQNDLEIDDMNIKSHLNTSFDISGISVSEDLINRTLEAIKRQPAEQLVNQTETKDFSKKVISWNKYIRGFAGVAAAVLIVVVGYNAMSQFNIGNSKSSSDSSQSLDNNSSNDIMMEEAAESNSSFSASEKADMDVTFDATSTDMATQDAKDDVIAETAPQYTITADAITMTDEAELYGDNGQAEVTGAEGEAGTTELELPQAKLSTTLRNSDQIALLTFRDIFLPAPEQAEYVMITDEINGTAITLTNQDQIKEFYTVMDQHQFTYGTEDTANQNYTVEVKSPEAALYTLIVGKNITVRYAQGDTVSQSIYLAVDEVLFKLNLDEFYKKYSK
ncbi:MAG: hypothetical protein ACYDEX_08660 [Mobilitalea sp.]